MSDASEVERDLPAALVERFSAYYDGDMSASDRSGFESELAADAQLAVQYRDFCRDMKVISSVGPLPAPAAFSDRVEEQIRRRSGGRFFGRRTFGDRVPVEWLALLALVVTGLLWVALRFSGPGPLDLRPTDAPEIHRDAKDLVPKP